MRIEDTNTLFSLFDLHSASTVCEMEAEYEEGNIAGVTYELDEATFPYGFFRDVEYSDTLLTISKAAVKKSNKGKHSGGVLAVEPGSSLKKEKPKKNLSQGKLRGSTTASASALFHRRDLAQTIGDR